MIPTMSKTLNMENYRVAIMASLDGAFYVTARKGLIYKLYKTGVYRHSRDISSQFSLK